MRHSTAGPFWKAIESHQGTAVLADSGPALDYPALVQAIDAIEQKLPAQRTLFWMSASNRLAHMQQWLACLRAGHPVILLDAQQGESTGKRYEQRFGAVSLQDWLSGDRCTALAQQIAAQGPLDEGLALLLPTSGSTGEARLVMLSRDNLQANAAAIVRYLEIDAHERAITSLAFAYSYGLSVLHTHLLMGASIVLTDEPMSQAGFWRLLETQAVTSLAGVPFHYELMDRIRVYPRLPKTLRTLTQAGGPLAHELVERWTAFAQASGRRFFVMYGQTEATARIAWRDAVATPERTGSIGRAIPGGELLLAASNRSGICGEAGELLYRGPNVMLGYATNPADVARPSRPSVLHTGDLARCDEDGFWYLQGRLNRMMKLDGRRFELDTLQTDLQSENLPVWLVPLERAIGVVLASSRSSDTSADQVLSHLSARLGLHPSRLRCCLVDALPRTGSGKPAYSLMQRLFDETC